MKLIQIKCDICKNDILPEPKSLNSLHVTSFCHHGMFDKKEYSYLHGCIGVLDVCGSCFDKFLENRGIQ